MRRGMRMARMGGRVLVRGLHGKYWLDSREGMRRMFFLCLLIDAAAILSFIGYYFNIIVNTDPMNQKLMVVMIICFIFSVIATYIYNPRMWDMLDILYENGLSGIGAPFAYYSEVEKIAYGVNPYTGKRYIQIFIKGRPWQKCPTYQESEYINDFFERAIEILREKCPDVPWVEMEWLEWKKKKGGE